MSQHDVNNDAAPAPDDPTTPESTFQQAEDLGFPDADQAVEAESAQTPDTPDSETIALELEVARAEIAELKEQFVRAQAEMENVRKRAERDVDAARKFGVEKFAKELLGVRDSLEAGLASTNESGTELDKLREGMVLTERMLDQAMEKFGVERVNPEGEGFDPTYHEAVSMLPSAEHAPNTVVTVIQKGYLLNGRVLRPAMVVVSSAAPAGGDE